MNHCCWSVDQTADVLVAGIDVVVVVAAAVGAAAAVKVTQTTHQTVVS